MPSLSEHVCYFDDSFNEQIHVVGGFLAPREIWEQVFSPAWKKIIADAPHPISEFKSSNARLRRKEFASWTVEEVESFTSQLVECIRSTPLYAGVSAAFLWPGEPDASSPKVKRWRKQMALEGYKQCIRCCLSDALVLSNHLPETEKVRLIFDRRVKFFDAMQMSFGKVTEIIGPDLRKMVKPPRMEDSKTDPPLQAADLLAYETFREVIARLDGSPPSDILVRLMEGRTPYISRCLCTPLLDKGESGGLPKTMLVQTLFKRGRSLRASSNWACGPSG